MMLVRRSFYLLALSTLALSAHSGSIEFDARPFAGRLEVDRQGATIAYFIRGASGALKQVYLSPEIIYAHNGLTQLEGQLVEVFPKPTSRFGQVPEAKQIDQLTPDMFSKKGDRALLGLSRNEISKPVVHAFHLSRRATSLYEATQSLQIHPTKVEPIFDGKKGLRLSGDARSNRVGARIFIDGDVRHYYLFSNAALFQAGAAGVRIEEVFEDRTAPLADGRCVSNEVTPISSPTGSFWLPGQTFEDRKQRLKVTINSANPTASSITIHPMITKDYLAVTSTADSGSFTLRGTILYRNNLISRAPREIHFAIQETSNPSFDGKVVTIQPLGPLPSMTAKDMKLDGESQRVAKGDTNPGKPVIYIDGKNAGSAIGLVSAGSGQLINSLGVINFSGGGIKLTAATGAVQRCLVGIRRDGFTPAANGYGVRVESCSGSLIGGPSGAGNVLSSNSTYGLSITGTGVSDTQVIGNKIGTDIAGSFPDGNGTVGIYVDPSTNTTIGANVIGSNASFGIYAFNVSGLKVTGNKIGVNLSANGLVQNQQGGIDLAGSSSCQIGGATANEANLFGGNGPFGVSMDGPTCTGNMIYGNYFGVSPSGTNIGSGAGSAVYIGAAAKNNSVGGTQAGQGNQICNFFNGVEVNNPGTTGNRISGNKIGVNIAGTGAMGNSRGIFIHGGASSNNVGGVTAISANILSGNFYGVLVQDPSTSDNHLLGNIVGTDATGTIAVPNTAGGINLLNCTATRIGSSTPGAGNVLSGNTTGFGINLDGATTSIIQGNFIGVTPDSSPLPNRLGISGGHVCTGNTIGGSNTGEGNVISANSDWNIVVDDLVNSVIAGNHVGTSANDSVCFPSSQQAISLFNGRGNTIGGSTEGAANVICGGAQGGIDNRGVNAGTNSIQGNYIGTNPAGAAGFGNGFGIMFGGGSSHNVVGTVRRNVISDNGTGIMLLDATTTLNQIVRNTIGLTPDLKHGLQNHNWAFFIQSGSSLNVIGLPGIGNTIAPAAGQAGIQIIGANSVGNRVRGNTFSIGASLNIDLVADTDQAGSYTSNANDVGDVDTGGNRVQNNADITTASFSGGTATFKGTFKGVANKKFYLDIYAVFTEGSSHHGGSQRYLGTLQIATNSSGNANFSGSFPSVSTPIGLCTQVTSTAGDSSEFGLNKLF